jgi:hypothetical protein
MSLREYHKRWEFDLKSSPERFWPFIADTNRFNRDTGVPQIEIEKDKRLRNARRKVRFRSMACRSNGKSSRLNGSNLSVRH